MRIIDKIIYNKVKVKSVTGFWQLIRVAVLIAGLLVVGGEVWGQTTRTWDGGGANDRWTTANNWSGNTLPMAGDNVVIPTGFNNTTISRVPNITLNSFTVASTGITFTANGTATSITISNAASDVIISGSVTLGDGTAGNAVNLLLTNFASSAINGSLTISNNASLVLGANRTLSISGLLTNNGTFTASNTNSDVIYNSTGAQDVVATTYNNLSIAGGNTKTLLGNVIVNNTLTLTNGLLVLGANDITLGTTATVGGAPGSSAMVVTNGTGQFIKNIAIGASSFIFPIGDNTGTTEYSPVTLNFSANTVAGTVGVNVVDVIHPANGLATNYISRYWQFSTTGLTNYTYTGAFRYLPADISGTEASLKLNLWDAADWNEMVASNASANVLTITGNLTQATGTLNGNDFTARTNPTALYYRSAGSGNWNTISTWEVSTDPNFTSPVPIPASSIPTNLNATGILISSGDNVTVSDSRLADDLTVDGTLTINNGQTLTIANGAGTDMTVSDSGTVNNAGTLTPAGTIAFSGTYIHNRDGGTIPAATWNDGSNCNITGITVTAPTALTTDPNFYNFTWNCSGQTLNPAILVGAANITVTVRGNMSILRTGATPRSLSLSNTNNALSLQIDGNLVVGDGTNNAVLNLRSTNNNITTVNLGGNISVNASATLTQTGTTSGTFNFGYNGATASGNVNWTGSGTYTNTYINYVIQNYPNGKTVNININQAIPAGRSLTVNPNARLNCGPTSVISGAGSFILGNGTNGAILGIAHTNGINGNITTTTRTFNGNSTGASFVYNSSVASQVTGINLPATIYNLLIENTFTGGAVTLSQATTVTNNISISNGTLVCGTNQITGNATGQFTMAANTGLTLGNTGNPTNVQFPSNFTSGNINLDPSGTVTYQANGAQTVSGTPAYGNLTLSTVANGFSKTLNGSNTRVNGTLTLNNNIFVLGNYDLTLAANSSIGGSAFSATNMIDIGTGRVIKEGNANPDFILTLPIGIGTAYTPVEIADFSATTITPSSSISIQSSATAASGVPGTHPLNRQWVTSSTGISGSVLADISFTYVAGDIPAGGTASLYEMVYKPASGTWGMPNGAGAAGVIPLRASAANTIDATWTGTEPEKRIFYSMKSGNWDDYTTWTLDPSGTQLLNPNNVTPTTSLTSTFDEVVILSGRTVTVTSNTKINRKLTVIGTLDFGTTTGHVFTTILGTGRIRLAGDNFPTGDASDFVTAGQGEGTVEYYGTTRSLNIARTYFNVDINMTTANTLTLLKDYIINGNLTVANGIFSVNDNTTTTPINITITGNLTVASTGKIITGSADARHQLNIYGDFTNNGDVRFTNRTVADYSTEATDGIADINFLNTGKDQNIMCRGITNFYRIEIDKGTDYTYNLNIDATAISNFNLLGYANENHTPPVAQLTGNNNALGLVRGSVRIGNSIVIPALSTADIYCISEGAQLWVDRGTVQKNIGQTIAIYGKLKITNGTLEANTISGITFRNNGILSVEGGTVNTNQIRTSDIGSGNYGGYVQTGGTVNVLGGTTNTDYYVFSLPYSGSVFNMSGGTLKINTSTANGGILINSGDENIKVTGGLVIAETNSTRDMLITSTAPFWDFSLKNTTAIGRQFTLGAAANIGPDNVNVTAQPLKVLNDFRIWGKESGGSSYPVVTFNPGTNDVYIGGSFFVENGAQYIPISGGTAPYDAIGNQPTSRNTTWFNKTTGTGMVEELYQGDALNPLEIGNFVVDRTSGYEVKLTSGASRTNESVALDINGNASVLSGTLNQNLFTIRTWGAIVNNDRMGTWFPGVTPSRAQIQLVENPSLTLTTTANAIFGNIQINVTPPSVLSLTSDVYIERMEYVKGLIYLKGYNLKVDNMWNLETGIFENSAANSYLKIANTGYSGSSLIYTDGKASDGGLSIKVTANSQVENQPNMLNNFGPITFPVGFTPNSGTTRYFRPAQLVVKGYSTPGYITIRPVLGALQTTNQTGATEVLQHYWRVSHAGFTSLPTVAYRFYYRNQLGTANIDLPTGAVNEASYVPGKVLDESPYTRQYEPLTDNDVIKNFGTGNNSRFITLNGTSTNGLFSPSSTGITLENANYSTGVAARFTGSVRIYYSIDNNNVDGNNGAPWNRAASWTNSDILNTSLLSPHNSNQPRSATIPGAGDVVVIGWVPWDDSKIAVRGQPHCIWLTDTRQVAEVVFAQMTDASGNPVARVYRSNFQFRPTLTINGNGDNNTYDNDGLADNGILTAKLVKGEGLFWNRQSDPDYTIMDIGDFARQDSSYVIYENFTDGRIINNTPALFPNIYISNDGWGGNDRNFTFAKDIVTTGNVELLGDVNLVLPAGATGNITAGRNLVMFENGSGGGARIDFGNSGTARKVIIKGDLLMKNSGSLISVLNPNAPIVDHELHVYGNIVQGTAALNSTGLELWSGANNDRITLYLDGNTNMTYNLVNGTVPVLYRLVVNKGNSITTTAQFNCDFGLNGPTLGAGVPKSLELQNGLFIVNNAGVTMNLTTGNENFEIPSTAGLEMRSGTASANGTSGISLDGLLRLSGGNLNMSGGDNPIQYSASGKATIHVTGGTLTVGGQIRRSATSNVGILTYTQTGGTVIVGNNSATQGNRGVFEILNAGSSFTMDNSNLYIVRAQTSPTISAFYFDPENYNITNTANIHIGYTTTPGSQTIGIYAGKPLPRLRVNNAGAAPEVVAKLEVVPATITSLLQIDAGTTFDANGLGLTLEGNMIATGTFNPNGNTTYISGSGPQTITGNGTPLNFYNLDKTATTDLSLNTGNTPLLVANNLFMRSGTFTDNGNTVTVRGDVLNNGIHINNGSGDGILLNGFVKQTLTGNGTFGKLTINNPNGVDIPVGNQLFISRSLKMQAGVLNIGRNLLDIGVSAVIEEASTFSATNMIETNISFTDNGVRKTFPAGASPIFTFPMGSGGKYTPVRITVSANNNPGSITVKPANEIHPSITEDTETTTQIIDKDNALQYYWTLKASGMTNFSAVARMRYADSDIKVGPEYNITNYHTASLLASGGGSWLKFPQSDFDEGNHDLIFNFTLKDDTGISGDYTAGAGDVSLNGAIPDMVSQYETNTSGDWTTGTIWTPNVSGGPRGAIAKINALHIVDVTTNYLAGYMTEVYGTLKLYSTFGHRLGIVNGTGTIYLELGDVPAAVYDQFFSSAGGTLEFGSTSSYEFLGNITEINHLKLSGTGERRFPNNNFTLNGNLTIAGGAGLSVLNYYNREISIKGDLTRTSGAFDAGAGANATLLFNGTLAQTITGSFSGSNALNNLEINNLNDISVINDVEIDGELRLNSGLINMTPGSLFRINYGATVSPGVGSPLSFINGVCTKELLNGNSFTFPIGNYSSTKAHGPITLQTITGPAGINDWKASYFYANATLAGYNTESFLSPVSTVSHSEYWKIEAPTGGASVISIALDGSSDVASSLTDLSNLRIVGWNGTDNRWEVVGTGATVTGTSTSGTITTTSSVNYGSYSYFTLASVTPIAASTATITSPEDVYLCNGSPTTIVVTFTGDMPYVLSYNAGATSVTTPPINASSYSITVTPSVTTIYTLTGITANGTPGTITGIISATIHVSPIPTVLLSNSPSSPICEGTGITFTATTGLNNYRFRVNGGTVQNGSGNTYTTSSLAVGTQSVDVTGTNAGGCSATSSAIAVVVNPKPVAAGAISGPASVCRNSNGTYTVPAIANATSYVWTKDNGATGTSATNSITLNFPNAGSTIITVYGVNACGNGVSSTFTVAVNTSSTPGTPGTITAVAEVCKGVTGYTCSINPVANATSYNWAYSGAGATFSGTGNSVTVDFSAGATNGNITVSATNGCSTTPGSTPFPVLVYTPPTATIAPVTPATCSGTPITITATPAGGTPSYSTHAWTGTGVGSLTSTTITNPSFNNLTGGDYDLTYTVTDSKGCIGSASTTVTVFQAPVAYAGPDALNLCTGTSPIALSGATASGSYSGTPTWSGTGGTWTQNPDPALATFTPSTPSGSTTATLTLTGSNGCASTFDTRDISWSKTPDQPGAFTASSSVVCQGQSNVIYTVPNDPIATSYSWSYTGSGATITGSTNSVTINFSATATTGILSVTATNSCGTGTARAITITVNLQPTITFGAFPKICEGITLTGITYTNITNSPNQYSINYDATAETAGFIDVTNAVLPAGSIPVVVPVAADASVYNAGITVRNNITMCSSAVYPVTVTLDPLPATGPVYRQPNN